MNVNLGRLPYFDSPLSGARLREVAFHAVRKVERFRRHLIEKVKLKEIDRDSANLYMNHIRQFYEWAFKQRRIEKIPFKYKTQVIKKKV